MKERDLVNEAYARVADKIVEEYQALPEVERGRFAWVLIKDLRVTLKEFLENAGNAART